jgi:uncharacterized protein
MWENLQLNRFISSFLPSSDEKKLLLLTGARQTGKTTLLRHHYRDLPYFNLDAIEYREQLREISSFSWARDVGSSVIDEVQKEPGLIDKIKFVWDDSSLKFTALSGSAQVMLLKQIRETLAGRVFILELFPLMLSELIYGQQETIKPCLLAEFLNGNGLSILKEAPSVLLGKNWDDLTRAEDHLMGWGGMPALIHVTGNDQRRNWLKDYSATYLERDLLDLVRINDLLPFSRFQRFAALRATGLLSFTDLARDAGLGIETARRYIEYLRISYQAFLIQPYHRNLTSSLVKTPRLYWTDNGLLRHLSGIGFDAFTGELYENYVCAEIMKFLRSSRSNSNLSFYRTRSGMEVDFCVEVQGKLLAIEAKFRDRVTDSDFGSLKKLRAADESTWLCGIVLYRGNKIIQLDETMWAIPSCRFFS